MSETKGLVEALDEAKEAVQASQAEPGDDALRIFAWAGALSARQALERFTDGPERLEALGADPDEVIAVAEVMLARHTGRTVNELGDHGSNQTVMLIDGLRERGKLAAVEEHVRAAMEAHRKEGGSFRFLIYNRMGLPGEAYEPLYLAGGMDFSNACPEGEVIEGVG